MFANEMSPGIPMVQKSRLLHRRAAPMKSTTYYRVSVSSCSGDRNRALKLSSVGPPAIWDARPWR